MRWLAILALVAVSGAAFGQRDGQFSPDYNPLNQTYVPSQNEADWKEGEAKPPAYPRPGDLIEFQVSALSSFRFFVDAASISPGTDGIVRFTLVARSRSGTENVSYEGLRCKTGEQKTYANGRVAEKTWYPVRDSRWKEVEVKTVTRQYLVLMRDFFCPAKIPIASAAEGVDALKRGYHPQAVSNHPEYAR